MEQDLVSRNQSRIRKIYAGAGGKESVRTFLAQQDTSTGREKSEQMERPERTERQEKPSVRAELDQIRQEKQESAKQKEQNRSRGKNRPAGRKREKNQKQREGDVDGFIKVFIIRAEPAAAEQQPRMSKEEYAALKKQEREEVWAEIDAKAQDVFKMGIP